MEIDRSDKSGMYDIRQVESQTLVPGKVTAIIPTSTAHKYHLLRAVMSLLANSTGSRLEHIIIVINGPDDRTGDSSLQDEKQRFVEDLRRLTWRGRAMPITLSRTWSRVGHAQAVESVIPWVHTQYYLMMHDDSIVVSPVWEDHVDGIVKVSGDESKLCCGFETHDEDHLCLPHLNTTFTLCDKAAIAALGSRWVGHSVMCDSFPEWVPKFMESVGIPVNITSGFQRISYDIGSWILYSLLNNGIEITQFPKGTIYHSLASSWRNFEKKVPPCAEYLPNILPDNLRDLYYAHFSL